MRNKDISELCITVIFQDQNKFHHSYQIAYHPCPVWMNGANDYKITMPKSGNYEFGSFEKLLRFTQEKHNCKFEKGNKSIIIADEACMNYHDEFVKIVKDIRNSGFEVAIMLI